MVRKQTSGEQTSSGFTLARQVKLHSIQIVPDGTNDVTWVIYDNNAASGKVAARGVTPGSAPRDSQDWVDGKILSTGMYVSISCAGTYKYYIDFEWL